MRRDAFFLLGALLLCILVSPARGDNRVALVIGNGAYSRATHLPNPSHDAEDVAAALRRSGFETMLATDLDKSRMDEALIKFAQAARTADVAMFYYSGHAMQFGGINYLVPIDAKLEDEADLRRMVRLDDIVADMQPAKNLRILVLDACRDNPLANHLRRSIGAARSASMARGLAKIDSPEGMIVAYATQAGRVADDGQGRNSPFTSGFLKNVEAKEEIGTIFRRVTADVYRSTRQKQLPELSFSLIGEFYLNGKLQITVAPGAMPAPVDPCSAAGDHWKSAEAINAKEAFEDHLVRFPGCSFTTLARTRIASLTTLEQARDRRRFDGNWRGSLVCEGVPGWKYDLVASVADGVFNAKIGDVGKPGSEIFEGRIEPDGTADIFQKGWVGDTQKDPYHRAVGTQYSSTYIMKFEGRTGIGTRFDRASCRIRFTKR